MNVTSYPLLRIVRTRQDSLTNVGITKSRVRTRRCTRENRVDAKAKGEVIVGNYVRAPLLPIENVRTKCPAFIRSHDEISSEKDAGSRRPRAKLPHHLSSFPGDLGLHDQRHLGHDQRVDGESSQAVSDNDRRISPWPRHSAQRAIAGSSR